MRTLRAGFLARRMASAWLLLACLMASVLITSVLISAVITFYSNALPAAVRKNLIASGAMSVVVTGGTDSSQQLTQTEAVDGWVRRTLGAVPYRAYHILWSDDLVLPGAPVAGNIPAVQAAVMDQVKTFAELVSGTWPARPVAGQPIPAALPAGAADQLKLRVGDVIGLTDRATGATVRMRVTGLYRRRQPASLYWAADPLGSSGVSVQGGFRSYGPAVVSPAAFGPAGGLTTNLLSVVALPAAAGVATGDLSGLANRLDLAAANIELAPQLSGMTVSTGLPPVLATAARSLAAARSLLIISALQLLILAAAALALAGRLLASHRDEESGLLAARGAARWQLARPSVAEAILTCAVAAAGGAFIGYRLAAALVARAAGQAAAVTGSPQTVWLGAVAIFLFCLGIAVWPAVRPARIAAIRIRRGRQAIVASAAAAGADVALLALAVLAVRELHDYSAAQAAAGTRVDPVIAIAPALALAGLAIIPLRLLPLAARGLERLSARSRRLTGAMANWEISRRPVRQSGPVLLAILAVGTGTLGLAQYQSWRQSVSDQAAFAAGADVRLEVPAAEPPSVAGHISGLPGVTSAMAVSQTGYGSGTDVLLAVGARQARSIVLMRPDLAKVPLSRLWPAITPQSAPGLALPGRPVRLAITARLQPGPAGLALGPASAEVTVQDASGASYLVPAGTIAADGQPHDLIAQLGPAGGVRYPLRLLGIAVTYNWPRFGTTPGTAAISITRIADSATASGRFGPRFTSGSSLAGWQSAASAPDLAFLIRNAESNRAVAPSMPSSRRNGSAVLVTFLPGNGPDLSARLLRKNGLQQLPGVVTLTAPDPVRVVPAIATSAFLAANNLRIGSTVPVPVSDGLVRLHIVEAVSRFPTVTGGGAIIADLGTLEASLASQQAAPLPVSAWWLRTSGGTVPAGLPPGSAITTAAGTARAMRDNPLLAAPVQAAVAISAAAALLAAVGFCVSVAASARTRRSQRALLGALGMTPAAQARLFCLEELLLTVPAAVVGLAVGIGLAHLLVPALTLSAAAGVPVPPVLVKVPLLWAVALALAVPAIPVLAAALSAMRQPDPAAELRAAEAA
ncbi:MAG: FtsX-like permease family protein [Streptosporangiaceae bacterium]